MEYIPIDKEKSKKELHSGLKCAVCGRIFDTKRGLVRHTYIHQSNPKFNCDTCGKIFTSQESLFRHSKSHDRDNKKCFHCKHCKESFTNKILLEEHHRSVHLGEKLFRCSVCGAVFSWEENLQKHQRMHMVDNYRCEFCERIFCDKISLKIHQRVHRPSTKPPAPNCKPFHCSFCGQRFQFDFSYKAHMNSHKIQTLNVTQNLNYSQKPNILPERTNGKSEPLDKPEDENDVFENSINTNRIPANEISLKARKAVPYKVSDEPHVIKNTFLNVNSNGNYSKNVENKIKSALKKCCVQAYAKKIHSGSQNISDIPSIKKRRVYNGRFGTLDMTDHKPFKCTKCTETFRWEVSLNVHLRVHEPDYMPTGEKNLKRKKIAKLPEQHKKLRKPLLVSPLKSQLVKRRAGSDDEDDDFQVSLPSSRSISKPSSTSVNNNSVNAETSMNKVKKQISSNVQSNRGDQQCKIRHDENLNGITPKILNFRNSENKANNGLSNEDVVITSITPIIKTSRLALGLYHTSQDQVVPTDTIKGINDSCNNSAIMCEKDLKKTDNKSIVSDMMSKEIDEDSKIEGKLVIDTLDETQLFMSVEPEHETEEEIWNQDISDENIQVKAFSEQKNMVITQNCVNNTSFQSLSTTSQGGTVLEICSDKGMVTSNNLLKSNNGIGNQNLLSNVDLEIVSKVQKESTEQCISAQKLSQETFSTFNGPITEITPLPLPPVQSNYEVSVVENSMSSINNIFPVESASSNISSSISRNTESDNSQCQTEMSLINTNNTKCNASNSSVCKNLRSSSPSVVLASNTSMLDYIQESNLPENMSDHQLLQGISNLMHVASENVEKYASSAILKESMNSSFHETSTENESNMQINEKVMMNLSNTKSNCNVLPNIVHNNGLPVVQELQNVQVSHDLAQNITVTQNVLQDVQHRQNVNQNLGLTTVQPIPVGQKIVTTNCCNYHTNSNQMETRNILLSSIQSSISSKPNSVRSIPKISYYEGDTHQSLKLPIVQSLLTESSSIQNDISKRNLNLQAMQDVVCKIPMTSSSHIGNMENNFDPNQYKNFQFICRNANFASRPDIVSTLANLQSVDQSSITAENRHQILGSSKEKVKSTANVQNGIKLNHTELKDYRESALDNIQHNGSEKINTISTESLNNNQAELIVVDSNSPVTTLPDERPSEFQIQTTLAGECGTTMHSMLPNNTMQINITNTNEGQIMQQNIGVTATTIGSQQNVVTSQSNTNDTIVPTLSSVINNTLTNIPIVQSNMSLLPNNTILCPQVQGNVQFLQGSLPNLQSRTIPLHSNLQNSIQSLSTFGMGLQTGVTFLGNVPNMLSNVPVQAGYLSSQQINCINEFGQIVAVTPLFQIPMNQSLGNSMTGNILSQNSSGSILQSQQIMTQPVIGQTIIQNSGAIPTWQLSSGINNADIPVSTNNCEMKLLNNSVSVQQFQHHNPLEGNSNVVDKLTQLPYQIPPVNFQAQISSSIEPQSTIYNVAQLDGCYQIEKLDDQLINTYIEDFFPIIKMVGSNFNLPQCFSHHITWIYKLNNWRKAYLCFNCRKLSTSRVVYRAHRMSRRKRLLHCKMCSLNLLNGLEMSIHRFYHFKLKCKICAKVSKSLKSLKQHLHFHQRLFVGIKCNVCAHMFIEVKGLLKHMALHHDNIL